jgi:hypothetical protein
VLILISLNRAGLNCYTSDQIPIIWPVASPLIDKALRLGSIYTLDSVYEGLCDKKMQLWMYGHDVALVTSIQVKEGKKFCLLLALGGEDLSSWFQYLPIVEDWAKDEGAEEVRVYGRLGWVKLTGYDIDYVKLVKKL